MTYMERENEEFKKKSLQEKHTDLQTLHNEYESSGLTKNGNANGEEYRKLYSEYIQTLWDEKEKISVSDLRHSIFSIKLHQK